MGFVNYSFSISLASGGGPIFNGYFTVDNISNVISQLFDATNLGVNIIAITSDDWGADYVFIDGAFTLNGTAITSIPALQILYPQAVEWLLYRLDNTDQIGCKPANGEWFVVISPLVIYTFTSVASIPTTAVISNSCFPAGTPISTNMGPIAIECIDTRIHTIRNKRIAAVTQSTTPDKYTVCFEKDAIGINIPSEQTVISKNHLLMYKGKVVPAKEFIATHPNCVCKMPYNGEILYNILLDEHGKMVVNNMICETLHPTSTIAQVYRILPKLTPEKQQEFVRSINKEIVKRNLYSSRNVHMK